MDRRKERLAYLILFAAVLLLGWPILCGRTLCYGDLTLQFIPWRRFSQQQLLSGVLPLWNPDIYLGMPFVANSQSAVFYPFHWLTLLLAPAREIALGYLVHLFLPAAGTYAFCRTLGRSRGASVVAGLAFGLGGYVVSKQQFPSLAYTTAWLPWLTFAGTKLWQRPGARAAALLAAIVGLQWLTGHAQMSLLQLALLVAWLVWYPGEGPARTRWGWCLAGLAVGTGSGLIQLLPTYELLGWSDRTTFGFADAARFNLPPWQTGMLLLPELFGSPQGDLPYLGVGAFWEVTAYVGLPTLALAWVGAKRERFWVGVAAVGLLLAFGKYTPIYGWCWKLLPPLRMVRDPARFLLYVSFALALLAAAGFDQGGPAVPRTMAWLAGWLGVGWLLAGLLPTSTWLGWVEALQRAIPTKSYGNPAGVAGGWQNTASGLLLGGALIAGLGCWCCRGEGRPRPLLGIVLLLDLLVHGGGLNPTCPVSTYAVDYRPAEVRAATGPIRVPLETLETVSRECFNLAQYQRPPRIGRALASLVPDTTMGTGTRQLGGYDPLRPTTIGRWLSGVESMDPRAREELLAGLGLQGELSDGQWRPYAHPAGEARWSGGDLAVRHPTPQRVVIASPGTAAEVALTLPPLPGWVGPRGTPPMGEVVAYWRAAAGQPLRLRYAPGSYRLGSFLALLSLALLAGLCSLSQDRYRAST